MNDAQRVIHLATVKAMRLYITRAIKTQDAYLRHLWQDAREYFTGEQDAFQFIDSMVAEIDNQLTRAWNEGAREVGVDPREMEDVDTIPLQDRIQAEREFILGLAGDIDAARSEGMTDAQFKQQFYSRVESWANTYREVVNESKLYFSDKGQKLIYVLGPTEKHCHTGDKPDRAGCADLAGIVMFASEWDETGIKPGESDSQTLACGGWLCQCDLVPTTDRRTPNGLARVLAMLGR